MCLTSVLHFHLSLGLSLTLHLHDLHSSRGNKTPHCTGDETRNIRRWISIGLKYWKWKKNPVKFPWHSFRTPFVNTNARWSLSRRAFSGATSNEASSTTCSKRGLVRRRNEVPPSRLRLFSPSLTPTFSPGQINYFQNVAGNHYLYRGMTEEKITSYLHR